MSRDSLIYSRSTVQVESILRDESANCDDQAFFGELLFREFIVRMRPVGYAQLSMRSPGTRSNSLVSLVTKIRPSDRA